MSENNNYTNDSIESFNDEIEAIRERPASIGIENHNHLFTEVLANSIDEAREGFGNLIEVIKHKDLSITNIDYGRGIPLGKDSNGEYVYPKVLCKLWSGGKMHNSTKNGGYLFSLGVNGCGLKACNFTSDIFQCTSFRDNKKFFIEYQKGRQTTELQEENYNYDSTGTIVTWKPSKNVFRTGDDTDVKFIETMLKQQSIVSGGLKFTFKNEIDNTYKEFYYENGIIDFIKEYGEDINISDIIYWSTETEGKDKIKKGEESLDEENNKPYKIKCNLAFTFNNNKQLIEFYHNGSYLKNGGTPEDFIKNAFVYSIDKYLKNNNLYEKSDKKISFEDIKDSLIIVSDTYSTISLYTDQAKKQIDSELMKTYMTDYLKQQLEIYFTENQLEANKICSTILNNARVNAKAQQSKLDLKKKLQDNKGNGLSKKIEGLQDCDMKHSILDERILLVVEGVSPFSTVVDSIDSRIMGVYALMGRFINSLKSTMNDVLNNKPAFGLIQAIGCGIEVPKSELKKYKGIDTFNKDNARYGNIGLLCDADAWGSGIVLANLSFIYKFLPTYLKEGRVFIIKTPRFEITTKEKNYYAYDEDEKNKIIKELTQKNIKHDVSLKKGLGEFSKDEFYEYVLSEEARKKCFKQVKWLENESLIADNFEMFMGDNIEARKNFIYKNIINLDIQELDV